MGEFFQHQVHADTRSFDHWLSGQYPWVGDNSFLVKSLIFFHIPGIIAYRGRRRIRAVRLRKERLLERYVLPHDRREKVTRHMCRALLRLTGWFFHIPPNLVVECVPTHRKPPEVRICRLSIQSAVGTRPPSTSTPHCPACWARR